MTDHSKNLEWLETAFDLYHILEVFSALDLPYTKAYEMIVEFLDIEIREHIYVYMTSNRAEMGDMTVDAAFDLFARCVPFYNKA